MEFQNHKITEAVCAFNFDTNQETSWNVGKFADFFKLIESHGFTKSEERRPTQIKFEFNSSTGGSQEQVLGDLQMLYTDEAKGYAILMSKGFISVHTLHHYPGWEVFFPMVQQFLQYFFGLGLGKKLSTASMLYINNFHIAVEENLSEYLRFVPDMREFAQGKELNHSFQSDFIIDDNTRLYLNTICQTKADKAITLQCNCLTSNVSDCFDAIQNSHFNAVRAFKTITQDKLKNQIR